MTYASPATRRWSETIDGLDGFVWVTPEYNHGVPAAMKNALDVLWPEWGNKTVGFVAYGFDGGTRSVEQWRMIVAAAFMIAVRPQVALQNFADFDGNDFTPLDRRERELTSLLNHLVRMTEATAPCGPDSPRAAGVGSGRGRGYGAPSGERGGRLVASGRDLPRLARRGRPGRCGGARGGGRLAWVRRP